jgi:hypothetical protein
MQSRAKAARGWQSLFVGSFLGEGDEVEVSLANVATKSSIASWETENSRNYKKLNFLVKLELVQELSNSNFKAFLFKLQSFSFKIRSF